MIGCGDQVVENLIFISEMLGFIISAGIGIIST